MSYSCTKWLKISLFNLMVVAFLGTILRYKIIYSLPFIDQKHLLQTHSHFAFSGWISLALMALMVGFLNKRGSKNAFEKYHRLLLLNLLSAYGMLCCFPLEGYGLFSISFSTLCMLVSFVFAFKFWSDLNKIQVNEIAINWFKAALLWNVISSLGAFSLAYMMANKIVHQNWYLIAVYFFLHFQYNGWFFFACIGLLFSKLKSLGIVLYAENRIFWLFAIACLPAYFFSTLWLKLNTGLYCIVLFAAFLQLIAYYYLGRGLIKQRKILRSNLHPLAFLLFELTILALSIKLVLQALSTIPSLNQLTCGFRPIVIGYLHLVLLGFTSLFILAFAMGDDYFTINKYLKRASLIFVSGIILNEILLMVQGVAAMQLISIPFNNELLLLAAFTLFSGAFLLFRSQTKSIQTD